MDVVEERGGCGGRKVGCGLGVFKIIQKKIKKFLNVATLKPQENVFLLSWKHFSFILKVFFFYTEAFFFYIETSFFYIEWGFLYCKLIY